MTVSALGAPVISAAGDSGISIRFGEDIDPTVNEAVLALAEHLRRDPPEGVRDVVPGFATLLVIVDPARGDPDAVRRWIEQACLTARAIPAREPRRWEIPVLYHPRVAPDLEPLAREKDMTVEELVSLHSSADYRCYLLGFRPGFPFLGGLDPRLWAARLSTPRIRVAAGSVGIGGRQTGIYPTQSPGGWRVIGRTARRLFDPGRQPPFLVSAGDTVRFVPVGESEFDCGSEG